MMVMREDVMFELDVTVRGSYKTEDVLRALQTSSGVSTPMLPDGCIAYRNNSNGYELYMCMRPPTVWQCGGPSADVGEKGVFPIILPWQLYLVKTTAGLPSHVRLFFSKTRVTSSTDRLYRSLLPNQGDNGSCCIHSDHLKAAGTAGVPLILRINKLIQNLSNSNFNNDLSGYTSAMCAPIRDLASDGVVIPGLPTSKLKCSAVDMWLKQLSMWSTATLATGNSIMEAYNDVNLVPYGTLTDILQDGC